MMKKMLALLLSVMMTLTLFTTCTAKNEAPAARTVVDMSGTEVTIPAQVNTYVESWFAHNAVDLMLNKAEGMLVTCVNKNSQPWMYIVCPNFYKADSTNFSADMNLEEIIADDGRWMQGVENYLCQRVNRARK